MVLLRSLIFYLGLVIATILMLPISILMLPFTLAKRFSVISRWSVFVLWWLKLTCNLEHEVEGSENIPDGAGIIICKHQSAWETLTLQLVFPAQIWIVKRELLWIPIYGWALATMQPIAINRAPATKALRQIVSEGCKRLEQGLWLVIFPEGTRVAPGEREEYQPGGGIIAQKSAYPVVPVAHNAGYFWPRNSISKWPGKIKMVIGPVIDTKNKKAAEITREAEDWIESTVDSLPKPNNVSDTCRDAGDST